MAGNTNKLILFFHRYFQPVNFQYILTANFIFCLTLFSTAHFPNNCNVKVTNNINPQTLLIVMCKFDMTINTRT